MVTRLASIHHILRARIILKSTATYQEDEHLHKCVKTLQKIDIEIKEREKQKMIVITGTELFGELSFTIDDEP